MKIRKEEIPARQRRKSLQFPELRELKSGECAVYDLSEAKRVRASVAYLKKCEGINFVTRTFPECDEIKVWLKNNGGKNEQ